MGIVAFYEGLSDTDENKVTPCQDEEATAMETDETEVGNLAFFEGLSDSDKEEVGNIAFYEGLSDSDEEEGNVA